MTKTLLIGPAGCGKTHRLLDEFEQALRGSPNVLSEDFFFILPSAEHTERVIQRLLQNGLKGFFHSRVTTLPRLIRNYFGMAQESFVSDATRFGLLKDLFAEHDWEYFHPLRESAGFIRLISRFLGELKESLFDAALFRERMNKMKQLQPAFAAKYEALASLYERYEERLRKEGLSDRADMLRLFRERKKQGRLAQPAFKKIWIDGFFDFSNLQLEYLKELALVSESITISLTKDKTPYRSSLFEAVQRTEEVLEGLGFKSVFLKPDFIRSEVPTLRHLERYLFCEDRPTKSPSAGMNLKLFEAVGLQGEMEMAAREITSLYRDGNYRYSDFAILFREIGNYESVIRSVFPHYGIPFEIHERERLKLNPLVHGLVMLLKIFKNEWSRNDLIGFLKSSYVRKIGSEEKKYEWVSELEHCAFREGILKGRDVWLGKSGALGRRLKVLADWEDRFLKAANFSELKKTVIDGVDAFGLVVREGDTGMVRRDAAGFARLEILLDEMQGRLEGRKGISFQEFTDPFLRLVEIDLYSLHHRDKNRVQVYSASLARQKEYKVVFVSGLLEKGFPIEIKENPLLSDWERQLLNQDAALMLKEYLPRQNIERYLFYLAVTRARERLILTYPKADREGKESLASFYPEEVRGLFNPPPREEKQLLSRPYPDFTQAVNLTELETALVGLLGENAENHTAVSSCLAAQLLQNEETAERFRRAFYQIKDELRDPAIDAEKFFRPYETSPTRLEEYAKCHYRYFAGRVLRLQDPEEEDNVKRKGMILHRILENYFRRRLTETGNLFQKETLDAFIDRELAAGLKEFPLIHEKKYQRELDYEEMREMLVRFLQGEIERLRTSSLQPRYFEFNFGVGSKPDAPALEIGTEGGRKIKLVGKIDRIDTDAGHRFGLVMDYKRTAQFKKEDLELGIALQLPVYLTVMEKYLKLKPVGGELYSVKERKKKGFYHEHADLLGAAAARSQKFSEEEYRKQIEKSLDFIRRFSGEIAQLDIRVRPRLCDGYCPYPSVCRIEKWRLSSILEEIKEEDKEWREGKDEKFEARISSAKLPGRIRLLCGGKFETNPKSE